jgi:hypothetical protein
MATLEMLERCRQEIFFDAAVQSNHHGRAERAGCLLLNLPENLLNDSCVS